MAKYVMALDAGTTSNRCILFDEKGRICSVAQKEFTQYFPQPGWVEHDADEIWSTQLGVAVEAMSKIGAEAGDIAAIGITNQRETVIVWDKITGEPVYHAIVWQCRRTARYCDQLKEEGWTEKIRQKTGLIIDAYFSATKIRWILEHVEGAKERAQRGELLFGTVETWLIWKLTKGRVHVTDYSNASRTMLFNINTLEWDQEILDLIGIPASMLPEVKPSSCVYGEADAAYFKSILAEYRKSPETVTVTLFSQVMADAMSNVKDKFIVNSLAAGRQELRLKLNPEPLTPEEKKEENKDKEAGK